VTVADSLLHSGSKQISLATESRLTTATVSELDGIDSFGVRANRVTRGVETSLEDLIIGASDKKERIARTADGAADAMDHACGCWQGGISADRVAHRIEFQGVNLLIRQPREQEGIARAIG
jgi:hypothetical protein